MKVISVDTGKYNTKAMSRDELGTGFRKFCIRTKIEEIKSDEPINGKSHILEYAGKKYMFGDDANVVDYDTTKKKLTHKLALYVAISNLLDGHYDDVKVITGCPLTVFLNPAAREEYRRFMAEEKTVEISIDGSKKRFSIADVMVLPESIGYPYIDSSRYLNGIVGIIDIGGLNSNGAIYERLKPVKASAFTINEGGNILQSKIKKALNVGLGLNYQDYEIPFLIEDAAADRRVRDIIDGMIKTQVETIIEEAKKNNWNVGGIPIIFTGGGSLLLQKEILASVPRSDVSANAVWDNVSGYLKIGEVKYGR